MVCQEKSFRAQTLQVTDNSQQVTKENPSHPREKVGAWTQTSRPPARYTKCTIQGQIQVVLLIVCASCFLDLLKKTIYRYSAILMWHLSKLSWVLELFFKWIIIISSVTLFLCSGSFLTLFALCFLQVGGRFRLEQELRCKWEKLS